MRHVPLTLVLAYHLYSQKREIYSLRLFRFYSPISTPEIMSCGMLLFLPKDMLRIDRLSCSNPGSGRIWIRLRSNLDRVKVESCVFFWVTLVFYIGSLFVSKFMTLTRPWIIAGKKLWLISVYYISRVRTRRFFFFFFERLRSSSSDRDFHAYV
jgi:hypothetical protein